MRASVKLWKLAGCAGLVVWKKRMRRDKDIKHFEVETGVAVSRPERVRDKVLRKDLESKGFGI